MELPVYRIIINPDDETGMHCMSLVDYPAVEKDFILFDKEKQLFYANEDKQIISGIALLADTPIYRRSATRGEYYVVFEKDTIRQLVAKYSKNGLFNSVNLQHRADTFVDCVHMVESMIIDKERGICPNEFADVSDGSWYVSYYVSDKELWNEIKTSGVLNGFSIELLSDIELVHEDYKINTKNNMNLFRFAKAILKLAEIPTDKETLIVEGELAVGKPVFIETEEGPVPAADGEYVIEDGRTVIVAEGIITEIKEVEVVEEKVEETVEVLEEEVIVEPEPVEDDKIKELEDKIVELEGVIAERDARIAELEAEIAEKDEKLKMSVETPITKKTIINKENKALKYFN